MDNIFFQLDAFNLKDESKTELNQILQFMESNPFMIVEIGGHTDNSGTTQYNLELSEQRALSVKKALVFRGLKEARILTKGYGITKALNKNSSEKERALNRRTELKIISVE